MTSARFQEFFDAIEELEDELIREREAHEELRAVAWKTLFEKSDEPTGPLAEKLLSDIGLFRRPIGCESTKDWTFAPFEQKTLDLFTVPGDGVIERFMMASGFLLRSMSFSDREQMANASNPIATDIFANNATDSMIHFDPVRRGVKLKIVVENPTDEKKLFFAGAIFQFAPTRQNKLDYARDRYAKGGSYWRTKEVDD